VLESAAHRHEEPNYLAQTRLKPFWIDPVSVGEYELDGIGTDTGEDVIYRSELYRIHLHANSPVIFCPEFTTPIYRVESVADSYFHGWLYRTIIDPALVPIRDRVRKWIPAGATVVDIGCGTGAQLFALSDHIARGLGIDISQSQIENA